MKMASFLAVLALCGALPAYAVRLNDKITPTQQVISMMNEMVAKGEKAKDVEAKEMAVYAEWTDDEEKRLGFALKTATSKIEELIAFASKADSDVAQLKEAIAELDKEIATLESELKAATDIRNSEHAEYMKVSTDYGESVDALERAIQTLSTQDYDRSQAMMLLQKMSTTVPGMPRVLNAFLQMKNGEPGAPEVAAYEFQSSGIVEMLEGLLKKFKGELSDVEEQESNQAHQYELTKIHLTDTIKKSKSDREEKAATKAKTAAASAEAKGELAETKAAKAADEKTLADMIAVFKEKSAVYEENQKVRADELEALKKAVEIISGEDVAGSYSERINLAQTKAGKAVSLLQLGSRSQQKKEQVAQLLKSKAQALNSKALLQLANQVPANAFEKVITMIEDLIQKLKEEAKAEADHKAWCDEQLKANKLKRNKKTEQSEKLMAEIQDLTATIEENGKDIAEHVKEQADLTKAMSEATDIRTKEKAENKAIVEDAVAGEAAVGKALVVLKEFYSKQASFLQRQVPEMSAYKGMQSAKGGVIGMLEVIESDFARLKAETTTAEAQAAAEYKAFMADSTADKEAHHKMEVKLRLDKDQNEFEKGQTEKDLEATNAELAKANEYFEYLKPSCLQVKVSWEERVAGRKAEIAALKEAYGILDQKSG